MPKTNVYDMTGKQVGEIELSEAVFGIEPNEAVVHDVVKNHLATPVKGILRGNIGNICFEKEITLAASTEAEITFSPEEYKQLANQHMKLWWPNGYGKPHMYRASYTFHTEQAKSTAHTSYFAGIREVTYKDEMSRLQLYINGQRFIPLGGNWGFSENHLNYRGRE